VFVECEAYNCNKGNTASQYAFNNLTAGGVYLRCIAHDNTTANTGGFGTAVNCIFVDCISDTNGKYGFELSGVGTMQMIGCDAYNNSTNGINLSGASAASLYIENCNLIKNGAWGINSSGSSLRNGSIFNCAFGAGTQANGSGTINGTGGLNVIGTVTYASNVTPWTDPANGDFRINLAAARAAGRGSFTQIAPSYAGAIGYPDIGAAQSITNSSTSASAYSFSQ
jgi:hypothetical protein